eukprot:IDg4129t1
MALYGAQHEIAYSCARVGTIESCGGSMKERKSLAPTHPLIFCSGKNAHVFVRVCIARAVARPRADTLIFEMRRSTCIHARVRNQSRRKRANGSALYNALGEKT